MIDSVFEVKTHKFQGPLELLLDLIEKRKFFINDISLAEIADDFISKVNTGDGIILENISQFINVASILLLIKSRSLLPNLQLTEEEEESIDDLEFRLKELKRMKDLTGYLGERFGMNIIFLSEGQKNEQSVFSPHESINKENILENVRELIKTFPVFHKEENLKAKVAKVVSLEEMIESLTERVKTAVKMSFRDFSKNDSKRNVKEKRLNTVVSFLAVLELFKQGIINLSQNEHFSDIEIESTEIGVPKY